MEVHKVSTPAHLLNAEDKYTASIELSNKCREFYKSRVEAAHYIKSRWEREAAHQSSARCNDNDRPSVDHAGSRNCKSGSATQQRGERSSIEVAMDKLRAEMSSLMDQDLSLMKQLLTLNETIEDLKWQRRFYSSPRSSADLNDDESDCSISDTEMYESEDDLRLSSHTSVATATTTTTTATNATNTTSCRRHSLTSYKGEKRLPESPAMVMSESSGKVYHGEQDSFDSGIHESCSSEEEVVLEASV